MDESSNPVSFFLELANLSSVERAGWGKRGIGDAESVSDHSFSMTMMNLMLKVYSRSLKKILLLMNVGYWRSKQTRAYGDDS
jgi:5'-deoxynucleotidase YfbR-like HD superfamily hydrolase